MNNDMNQNNNNNNQDFYKNDDEKIYQFQANALNNNPTVNQYDNMNNNNMMNNPANNGMQYDNQMYNSGDPLGIANNSLLYSQGSMNEQLVEKIYKMPARILGGLIFFGILAFVGLILIIVGASNKSDDLYSFMGIMMIALGVSMSLVFVPMLLKNKKMANSVSREELRAELKKPYYYLKSAKTYFTENYIISLFTSKVIVRYGDVVWAHEEARVQQNGALGAALTYGLGNSNILLVMNDKKKYRFPSCNQANSIYSLLEEMNDNIILGDSKEAKEAYKSIKNGYSNNMNNQNNTGMMNNNMQNNNFQNNMNNQYNDMNNNMMNNQYNDMNNNMMNNQYNNMNNNYNNQNMNNGMYNNNMNNNMMNNQYNNMNNNYNNQNNMNNGMYNNNMNNNMNNNGNMYNNNNNYQ